jgi:hypothetical protein
MQPSFRRQAARFARQVVTLAQTGIRARLTQIVDWFAQTIRQISADGQSGLRGQADRFSADRQAGYRTHAARQSYVAGSHISNIFKYNVIRAQLGHIANDYHAKFVRCVPLLFIKHTNSTSTSTPKSGEHSLRKNRKYLAGFRKYT